MMGSLSSPKKSMALKFSLTNLLLLTAFVAVSALAYSYRKKLERTEALASALQYELDNSRPIAFREVKRQIRRATEDITSTTVDKVSYSSLRDRYEVVLTFVDPNTQKRWSTAIALEPNGDGSYSGRILSSPFAQKRTNDEGDILTIPYKITIKDSIRERNDSLIELGFEPEKNPNWPLKE